MADNASILVSLATYNEIENLPSLVEAVHAQLPDCHLLVVDDNSPDGTGRWCQQQAQQADWFSCVVREGKLGVGSALKLAMQEAVGRGYRSLVTMDADWSHPPEFLPALVAAGGAADVVIGSRYCPGGSIENWPWRRHLSSRAVNFFTRCLLGVPVRDCSGNFRLYSTALLEQLPWDDLQADGYAYLEEVLWHLHRRGATAVEVPIRFAERRAGQSKISMSEALGAAGTIVRLGWRRLCR